MPNSNPVNQLKLLDLPIEILALILSYLDEDTLKLVLRNFLALRRIPSVTDHPHPRQLRLAYQDTHFAREVLSIRTTARNVLLQSMVAQHYPQLSPIPENEFKVKLRNLFQDSLTQNQSHTTPEDLTVQETIQFGSHAEFLKIILGPSLPPAQRTFLQQRLFLEPVCIKQAMLIYPVLARAANAVFEWVGSQAEFNVLAPTRFIQIAESIFSRRFPKFFRKLTEIPLILLCPHVLSQMLGSNKEAKVQELFYFLYEALAQHKKNPDYQQTVARLFTDFNTLIAILKVTPSENRLILLLIILQDHPILWKKLIVSSKEVEKVISLLPTDRVYAVMQLINQRYPQEWERLFKSDFTYARLIDVLPSEVIEQIKRLYHEDDLSLLINSNCLAGLNFVTDVAVVTKALILNEEVDEPISPAAQVIYLGLGTPGILVNIGFTAVRANINTVFGIPRLLQQQITNLFDSDIAPNPAPVAPPPAQFNGPGM